MGTKTTKIARWGERILKEMDKRSLRLEKIGKLRKKESWQWMG